MAYNLYKEIPKFKAFLEGQGLKKDISKGDFCKNLMIFFGMKKQTSLNWLKNFELTGQITNDNDIINFKVNE